MELWQLVLIGWGAIAFLERRNGILEKFARNLRFPLYEKGAYAFVNWTMELAWPFQSVFLPAANWCITLWRERKKV